jgi:hypothetical protein
MCYIIDGKEFKTSNAKCIYSDGQFSNSGVDYYLTKGGQIVKVNWSHWQGDHDSAVIISKEVFIEQMKERTGHPDRSLDALKAVGVTLEQVE